MALEQSTKDRIYDATQRAWPLVTPQLITHSFPHFPTIDDAAKYIANLLSKQCFCYSTSTSTSPPTGPSAAVQDLKESIHERLALKASAARLLKIEQSPPHSLLHEVVNAGVFQATETIKNYPNSFPHINAARDFVSHICHTIGMEYTYVTGVKEHYIRTVVNYTTATKAWQAWKFDLEDPEQLTRPVTRPAPAPIKRQPMYAGVVKHRAVPPRGPSHRGLQVYQHRPTYRHDMPRINNDNRDPRLFPFHSLAAESGRVARNHARDLRNLRDSSSKSFDNQHRRHHQDGSREDDAASQSQSQSSPYDSCVKLGTASTITSTSNLANGRDLMDEDPSEQQPMSSDPDFSLTPADKRSVTSTSVDMIYPDSDGDGFDDHDLMDFTSPERDPKAGEDRGVDLLDIFDGV